MEKLHAVRAQVRGISRAALVGTLVGLISAQAFASGLTETVNAPSQTKTTNMALPTVIADTPAGSSSSNALDASLLPSAPEVAKLVPPAPLDPMVADAAQSEQALHPLTSRRATREYSGRECWQWELPVSLSWLWAPISTPTQPRPRQQRPSLEVSSLFPARQ